MEPKRGCGCLVLLLAVLNLFVVVTLLYGIAAGNASTNVGISLLLMAVFVSNIAVCVMLGLPAIRRGGVSVGQEMQSEEDAEGSAPEGEGDEP